MPAGNSAFGCVNGMSLASLRAKRITGRSDMSALRQDLICALRIRIADADRPIEKAPLASHVLVSWLSY